MKRLQITVSDKTAELIERCVDDIRQELDDECAVVRTGYAIGVILDRYYQERDIKESEDEKQ